MKKGKTRMEQKEVRDELIIGRNPVMEALKAGRNIDTIFVSKGERQGSIGKIIATARDAGVLIKETDPKKLGFMCGNANHQGVIAKVAAHEYASLDDLFARAEEKGEAPFFIIADEVSDPHNLGAIIRTAECAGAHGVIVPKRRSATLNYTVDKTSAGALEYLPVARPGVRRTSRVRWRWSSGTRAKEWAGWSGRSVTSSCPCRCPEVYNPSTHPLPPASSCMRCIARDWVLRLSDWHRKWVNTKPMFERG